MAGKADSVQELESVNRDDNDVNLELSVPHLDQVGNKNIEEMEVEVCTGNDTSEVSPTDTSKGSRVEEEHCTERKDNVEVNENDDSGLEASWKDNNLVSSLHESDQFGNKKVEVMEEPKVNDIFEESPHDTSKVSRVKEKGGQESKGNVEGDNAGSEVHGKDDNCASSLPESDEERNKME
eukprot:4362691-Ditylum_brightwellii.AAC.1